jgi:DNA-binding HxlR family transcriptional regulator
MTEPLSTTVAQRFNERTHIGYTSSMLGKDYDRQDCSLARSLEVVGERWTLLIVRDAFHGVRRFSDFQAHLDIPKAVLSDRLAGLVEDGILERRPDPSHAGRHLYELTAAGRDLWPALHALLVWGGRHRSPNSRVFKHAACGTLLNDAGYCTRCDLTPGPEDIVTEPRGRRAPLRDDPVAIALRAPHRLLEPIESYS